MIQQQQHAAAPTTTTAPTAQPRELYRVLGYDPHYQEHNRFFWKCVHLIRPFIIIQDRRGHRPRVHFDAVSIEQATGRRFPVDAIFSARIQEIVKQYSFHADRAKITGGCGTIMATNLDTARRAAEEISAAFSAVMDRMKFDRKKFIKPMEQKII